MSDTSTAIKSSFPVIDPATGRKINEVPAMPWSDAERAIEAAHTAFLTWRHTSFAERAARMKEAGRLLRSRSDMLAEVMTQEMGKTLKDGRDEVEKCAFCCDYYAEHAARFLAREPVPMDDKTEAFVTYNPLGLVLAIMPWNFPLWQVFRFASPGLMAGNGCVLKHAANVPGCAIAIEAIFRDAGFPPDLFRNLLIDVPLIADVIKHKRVAAVTLTGSVRAGKSVAEKAGAVLKKCVLELGGSDAYVVLADADIELSAQVCATGRLVNNGQSCIAAKRFIVVDAVRPAFEKAFVAAMKKRRVGDPRDPNVDLGPMARVDLRDELHRQVQSTLTKGARLLLGGEIRAGPGAYYPPTVLSEIGPGMAAYSEELFGPVASIIPARDDEHAIFLANDSDFGLGSAVFSRDRDRAVDIAANRLEAGASFVNTNVRSDPRLPFGGVKSSGYGRELSHFGIREFVNIKAVRVA
jgi:succinate-semialdehyde dehydrogenase / glutarate-semialdehyde dehydrogenase